jgi:trehalose 6-phosphate phosphatase
MHGDLESLVAAVTGLSKGRRLLLCLDYDGTLVEIAPRPELAIPSSDLLQILARLTLIPGVVAVVVVSGRPLLDLMELLPIDGLNLVGSHGGEGRIGGKAWTLPAAFPNPVEQSELHQQLLDRLADLKGWWLEHKPLGFAVHYRQATPDEEARLLAVLGPWLEEVAQVGGHQVLSGKKVVEIMPQGIDKGATIQDILQLPGYVDGFPLYLGDDVTDESAFLVLQGRGLTVKVGGRQGATAATHSLANPAEVRLFLSLLAAHLEKR